MKSIKGFLEVDMDIEEDDIDIMLESIATDWTVQSIKVLVWWLGLKPAPHYHSIIHLLVLVLCNIFLSIDN